MSTYKEALQRIASKEVEDGFGSLLKDGYIGESDPDFQAIQLNNPELAQILLKAKIAYEEAEDSLGRECAKHNIDGWE